MWRVRWWMMMCGTDDGDGDGDDDSFSYGGAGWWLESIADWDPIAVIHHNPFNFTYQSFFFNRMHCIMYVKWINKWCVRGLIIEVF